MSNELFAFLNKDQVPNREAWQAAIDECGFDYKLDPRMKPLEDSGYSPARLLGKDAGVEIEYYGDNEFLDDFADVAQGRNFCIAFRWGGSFADCASGMIASYTLAKHFGAIVSYEGEDPKDLDALLDETKECLEEAKRQLK